MFLCLNRAKKKRVKMIKNDVFQYKTVRDFIIRWEEKHPYRFAFCISSIILLYLLFYSRPIEVSQDDLVPVENITFVDIEKFKAAKFVARKDYTDSDVNVTDDTTNVERATGTSEDADAVDLAFFPSVTPPKLIGSLKKNYPEVGEEESIEAIINVDLLISSSGKVKRVDIVGIRLSKEMPVEKRDRVSKDFAREAIKSLILARFTPTIIEGKQSPVKWNFTLKFQLEE